MTDLLRAIPILRAQAVERLRHYLYRLHQRLVPAPIAMAEIISDAWFVQAVTAAAQLGVADALAAGPLARDELARRVGADADALARLLRALVSRGVFQQRRDGRYELNALSATLRSDAPMSMRGMALFLGSRQHREHWSYLAESVRTGKSWVPQLRGKDFFEYLADTPEFADIFNNAMTNSSAWSEGAITAGYDFSRFRVIADVGGGHGRFLSAILAKTPGARGVLFDQPEVVAGAPALLSERGMADRVAVESGSFFESAPAGADAYLLKNIIHDWPDEQALAILRNLRAAAKPGATVLLAEMVIPDHDRAFFGKLVDLEMLAITGARERTEAEYRNLLQQAGFRVVRVAPTTSGLSLVEAVPR